MLERQAEDTVAFHGAIQGSVLIRAHYVCGYAESLARVRGRDSIHLTTGGLGRGHVGRVV